MNIHNMQFSETPASLAINCVCIRHADALLLLRMLHSISFLFSFSFSFAFFINKHKMLSYRRETALQGAL